MLGLQLGRERGVTVCQRLLGSVGDHPRGVLQRFGQLLRIIETEHRCAADNGTTRDRAAQQQPVDGLPHGCLTRTEAHGR